MQTSLILDLVLVVILISSTLRGWRNGLLVTGLGLLGFVLGAGLALWGAPGLIARVDALSGNEAGRSLVLFFVVVVVAIVGQSVLVGWGTGYARRRRSGPSGRSTAFSAASSRSS